MPVHNTFLGIYKDEYVVACEDFTPYEYKLQEFSWFMKTVYRKNEIGRTPSYNQIYRTIEESTLSQIKDAAIERYWDTFVFDALVGNFDRHKGNWGYFVNEAEKIIRLAPIYDNGSCLYPSLSDEGMMIILSDSQEIDRRLFVFPKPALNKNDDIRKNSKYGYLEMLSADIDNNCINSLEKIKPRIDLDKINTIIDDTPLISQERKLFYKEMLRQRKEKIIDKAYNIQLEKGNIVENAYSRQHICKR